MISNLPQFNPITLLVSAVSLGLLLFLRARYPKIPAGLVLLAIIIPASALLNLQERGVSLVGTVPQGLPQLTFPPFPFGNFAELVVGAMGIIFLAAGESLGTARAFATRYREPLDADQELIALGGSNIASGLFLGLSVDVSMSTTATSDNAGAKTQLTSLVAAGLVIVTLLILAPLFALLPNAVLGVLVIVSVFGLMDVAGLRRIYAARRTDFVLAMAACWAWCYRTC